jgi:predicted negative regulator of RcsB-dependent stress response
MPENTSDTPQLLGEISNGPSAFEQFLDRNQKGLIVVSILAALAGCAVVVHRGIKTSNERDAGALLLKAEDLATLQSIAKDYSGTAAAGSSSILTAEKQWSEGQQDAAIETLKSFVQANAEHPAWPTAQASLGSKLMSQGKTGDAEAAFQSLVASPSGKFLAPYALTQLGDIAKLAGDIEKARGFYEKAKADYSSNNFSSNLAGQHLLNLTAKPPVEIDAPPPPPPVDDVKPANLGDLQGLGQPSPGLPFAPEPVAPDAPAPVQPPASPGQ